MGFWVVEGAEKLEIRTTDQSRPSFGVPAATVELITAMVGKIVIGRHLAGANGQ